MSNSPIEKFVEELDEDGVSDLVLIAARQDPTEAKAGGGARWNSNQRELIMSAQAAFDEAGLDASE